MTIAIVRVERRQGEELKHLMDRFNRMCRNEANIPKDFKQHQAFESSSRKRRRKHREAAAMRETELARLKNRLRENFPNKGR